MSQKGVSRLFEHFGSILEDELVDVKLPLAALIVHEPDLAEHGSLGPTLIVHAAHAPHDAHVAVGVVAVQGVAVVEANGLLQGLLGRPGLVLQKVPSEGSLSRRRPLLGPSPG